MTLLAAATVVALASGCSIFGGQGPARFPPPVENQAVYDEADAISPEVEAVLEAEIDAIEARSRAELAIYLQVDGSATEDSNLDAAKTLMREWGVGRQDFDDGMVILVSFEPDLVHGVISTWGGDGFLAAYLSTGEQETLRDVIMVPAFRSGEIGGGLLAAVEAIDAAITQEAASSLETYRVINAMVGIPGGILALFVTLGMAYVAWRRYGDDPDLTDSESILMAGPPAGMTPPLATVVRSGKATQHSVNTTLIELASVGHIAFRNLDRVGKGKSDDEPDPLLDPAIEVFAPPHAARPLAAPQTDALKTIRKRAVGGQLTREPLWGLNDDLDSTKKALEREAVRLGWFERLPSPLIGRWVGIGFVELLLAGALVFFGFIIPMSGLTLLGFALGIGAIGTMGFGLAMSKRTQQGAYVDAMLKAYRRTLEKTLEQARNMNQVVQDEKVRVLADTPDKAVVWGIALGLHRQVSEVLERGFADARQAQASTGNAYYPVWLGSSSDGSGFGGGAGGDGGSLFSGSGMPDVGGMIGSLGSIGSSPPSSSSSGGGFGGGGSSGGGGGSSSF